MIAPPVEIKNLLVAAGAGVFASVGAWPISIGTMPDAPDQAIAVYESPGEPANPKYLLDFPRFQLVIRDIPQGYITGWDKSRECRDVLLGLPSQTLNGTRYVGIWQVTETFLLRKDEKDRPLLVSNWRLILEPPDEGGNRIPL